MIDKLEFTEVENIIPEFSKNDQSGQVFRYPEDLKGNQHLTGLGTINQC
jgi:hypothetical protein